MRSLPLITLTTDFGTRDSYVAQMKGEMYSRAADITLVDLSHTIPPQDIAHAARFIAEACPRFPRGTIHVIVVDPGVGTDRDILVSSIDGQHFVCPDNGLLSGLLAISRDSIVRRLLPSCPWLGDISPTFHGRDVMGKIAVEWAMGRDIVQFSEPLHSPVRLDSAPPVFERNRCRGKVVGHDSFGNLLTDIRAADLPEESASAVKSVIIQDYRIQQWVRTYGEARPGSVVALEGSSGFIEIAVVNGNAAASLDIASGIEVIVQW